MQKDTTFNNKFKHVQINTNNDMHVYIGQHVQIAMHAGEYNFSN